MPTPPLKSQLRVLLVEDHATDALMVRDELAHATGVVFVLEQSKRLEQALAILADGAHFDVVLLDLSLPDSEGLDTFSRLRAAAPGVPVVVVSHRDDEALALKAVQAGAQDYLVKGQFEGQLIRAIRYAVERANLEAAHNASEAQLHLLNACVARLNDVVIITSADPHLAPYPRIVFVNDAFVRRTGYTREEALRSSPRILQGPATERAALERIGSALKRWQPVREELVNYTKAGEAIWLEVDIVPLRAAHGGVTHWVAVERDITERKQAALAIQAGVEALQDSQRQLQTLSHRILSAQETERRRVALELHDELGQSLTAIKINLMGQPQSRMQPATELELENIRIVEDALQQVRRLALALRPSMLDDLGLQAALSWLVQSAMANRDLVVNLRCAMRHERIAPDMETACFRIVQEALTNIRRHARAKVVDIELETDDDDLTLLVRDDGVGFDLTAYRDGNTAGFSLGLLGIQERALGIGGKATIETAPGRGCTVRLDCALDATPLSIL